MTIRKKNYEKPVIQDLGQILTGSAQMPMGMCTTGDTPSGPVTECTGGNMVQTECNTGSLFNYPEDVCQAGGIAAHFCSFGGEVG